MELVHLCKVLVGLDQPRTQVTREELSVMLKYSGAAGKLVEIGCYEGASTVAFARSTKGQVYSIDLFMPGRVGVCYGYWVARSHLQKNGIRNVQLIKSSSQEAAKWMNFEIDFLFIDGDHSLEGVARDWSDWFPKVKTGGIIAVHDCRLADCSHGEVVGTMQFYRERLLTQEGLVEIDGIHSLAVFKKLS